MSPSLFILPAPLLAVLPEHPKFGESLVYQFNGLVVVFIALGLIWVMMEALGAVFKRVEAIHSARIPAPALATAPALMPEPVTSAAPVPAPLPDSVQAALPSEETISATTYAIIAAAVHVALGRDHHVVAITLAPEALDWSHEGRRAIFTSHKVR